MAFPLPDPATAIKIAAGTKLATVAIDKAVKVTEDAATKRTETANKQRAANEAKRAEYLQRQAVNEDVRLLSSHPARKKTPPRIKPTPNDEEEVAHARARKCDSYVQQAEHHVQVAKLDQESARKRAEAATIAAQEYRRSQEVSSCQIM